MERMLHTYNKLKQSWDPLGEEASKTRGVLLMAIHSRVPLIPKLHLMGFQPIGGPRVTGAIKTLQP